jgi:ribonuclease III
MAEFSDVVSDSDPLAECERRLQYAFRDRGLLRRCLTHSSIAPTRLESNERLEFLGDAILGAVVCEMLFQRFPDEPEGELTRIKSVVVSRTTCAKISGDLNLHDQVFIGKGLSGFNAVPSSVMAAVFESLIAGIYLDGGYDAAQAFVGRLVGPEIDRVVHSSHGKNYKSLLQQHTQKLLGQTPVYRIVDEKGPDHSKCFLIAAIIGGEEFESAWGPNKKDAEQRAAENAWFQIQGRTAGDAPEASAEPLIDRD